MTILLEKAVLEISKLPEDEQNDIARALLEKISSDAKWGELFADPRSEELLDRFLSEIDAEVAAGTVTSCESADLRRNR